MLSKSTAEDKKNPIGNLKEDRALADALSSFENNSYVYRSQYYLQLEQYMEHYPASQVLVLIQEELKSQRPAALQKVFRFLGVEENFVSLGFRQTHYRGQDRRRKNRIGLYLANLPIVKLLKRLPPSVARHFERVIFAPFSSKVERAVFPPDLRERLTVYLQEDTNRLRRYLGLALSQWSVAPTPKFERTLKSPKQLVQVAANSAALVQQTPHGTALQFAPDSSFPGVILFLTGVPAFQLAFGFNQPCRISSA